MLSQSSARQGLSAVGAPRRYDVKEHQLGVQPPAQSSAPRLSARVQNAPRDRSRTEPGAVGGARVLDVRGSIRMCDSMCPRDHHLHLLSSVSKGPRPCV